MNLQQVKELIEAERENLAEQMAHPRNLFHFHSARAADSTYQVLLALTEPVRNIIGVELPLQRTYLREIAEACERVALLLRQVEEGYDLPQSLPLPPEPTKVQWGGAGAPGGHEQLSIFSDLACMTASTALTFRSRTERFNSIVPDKERSGAIETSRGGP